MGSAAAAGGRAPGAGRWALGFTRTRTRTPSLARRHDTVKALDATAAAAARRRGGAAAAQPWGIPIVDPRRPAGQPVASDGQALRGLHGEALPGGRLVARDDGAAGRGDRRQRGGKTNEETEEGKPEAGGAWRPRGGAGCRCADGG